MTLLSPDYIGFWIFVGVVVVVILGLPLYGIWYEEHKKRVDANKSYRDDVK